MKINKDILSKLGMPDYNPLPLLSHGKTQTIASYYFPYNPILCHAKRHIIDLADGDKIVVCENQPLQRSPSKRIVLLIHGLTGSHLSKYVIRMTHLLLKQGFVVMRMCLRGCGAGIGLAQRLYHSGRSDDTRTVLCWLAENFPNQAVTQIGFSLGGNITLKMAGEDGPLPSGNLDSVVAVSAPLCLASSVKLIIHQRNKIFNRYFVKGLLNDVKKLHEVFPELPQPHFPTIMNVYEFDDYYTAPRNGFKSADDYYARCSSWQFIDKITLPTFILYAKDDPVISRRKFLQLPAKDNFDTLITSQGGHVSWLGASGMCCHFRWMDRIVAKWISWFDAKNL